MLKFKIEFVDKFSRNPFFSDIRKEFSMKGIIGIRNENFDLTEKRTPLTPSQVRKLVETENIQVIVQPAPNRIFSDREYAKAGAIISEDLNPCQIIFGVKEIPVTDFLPAHAYCFFSHTIKGQPQNMPMLKRVLDLKATLIDYEKVADEKARRLIFFGKFAGYAGMIDVIWALGLRLQHRDIPTPFASIHQALKYDSLGKAKKAFRQIGEQIARDGLPENLLPLVCGFTGYGHVSQGAQEIFNLLPHEEVSPDRLISFIRSGKFSQNLVYKVVFREADMFRHKIPGKKFHLRDYYDHPENYTGIFHQYLPYLSVLINGIYWEPRYPRLVTREAVKSLFRKSRDMKLKVIGDITCDVNGSVECTLKATNSASPVYSYHPLTESIDDGYQGEGVIILAVDKLPSELPRESSQEFGKLLLPFVPALAGADYQEPMEKLIVPEPFYRAVIAHQGHLMPDFHYLREFIGKGRRSTVPLK